MARTNNLTNFLNDVATAIKAKLGDNTSIPAAEFDTKIMEIETAGNYQNKSITITTNGNYNLLPDTGFDAMNQVVISVNVPTGGSGGVKLFETVQAMQADPNPSVGDLAVVYRNEIQNWDGQSSVSGFTFPSSVTLSTAVTEEINGYGRGGPVRLNMSVSSNTAGVYIEDWSSGSTVYTEYSSQDGITYTRTDSGESGITFGDSIGLMMYEWNNICGYFLQTGGMFFEGLYEYKHVSKGSFIPTLDITKQNILAAVNGDTVANANTNTIYVMNKYTELNSAYAGILIQNSSLLKTYKDSQGNTVNIRLVTEAIFYDPGRIITVYNNDVYLCDQASYNADDLVAGWNKGYYTLQNNTITFHKATTGSDLQLSIKPGSGYWVNGQILSGQSFILSSISTNNASMLDGYMVLQGAVSIYDVTSSAFTSHSITNNSISVEEWGYVIADTQLTLSQANQLLPDIIGYGKNGLVIGDNTIYNNLSQSSVFSNIYNFASSTTNITNSLVYNNHTSPYLFTCLPSGEYKSYYLKRKTTDSSADVTYIDNADITFSPDHLLQYADILDIDSKLSSTYRYYANSTGSVVAIMYSNEYADLIVLDTINRSIIRTITQPFKVKYYNDKLYYTKQVVSVNMTDKNIYCYDLNTDTETIFTSLPDTTLHTQETVSRRTLFWNGDRGLAYTYSKVTKSGYTYYNDFIAKEIDLSTGTTTVLSQLTWTGSGTSIIGCMFTQNSVFIEVDRYTYNNVKNTTNRILYKYTNGSWVKLAEGYTNRKLGDNGTYSDIGYEKNNYIYYKVSSYNNTIQKVFLATDTSPASLAFANAFSISMTANNLIIPMPEIDRIISIKLITDATDDGTNFSFTLDNDILFVGGNRCTFYNSNVHKCQLIGNLVYVDTSTHEVQFKGTLNTKLCKPEILSFVDGTNSCDIMAIDLNNNTNTSDVRTRLIPLNTLEPELEGSGEET